MSVMLFEKKEVFTTMARSYEGLKPFAKEHTYRSFSEEDDNEFYKALRRLHFANVACFLCQYHDDTPLEPELLQGIDPFADFRRCTPTTYDAPWRLLKDFVSAWGRLKYNLYTNDGELYKAVESYEYIEKLVLEYTCALLDALF